jgi:hypothetical protein
MRFRCFRLIEAMRRWHLRRADWHQRAATWWRGLRE